MLLVLLALGVAGMHTLGHADSSGHAGFSPSARGRNEVAMDLNAVSKETPAATPGDSADRGIHTLALTVCLAVLGQGQSCF